MIFQPGSGSEGLKILKQGNTGNIGDGSSWSGRISDSPLPKLFFVKTGDANATANSCAFGWVNSEAYLYVNQHASDQNRFECLLRNTNLVIYNETGEAGSVDYLVLG